MHRLRTARNLVFVLTAALWLVLCWKFWRQLVIDAADSPEIYTHTPGFQALNFAVQYLWFFVLILAAVLLAEWLAFRAGVRLLARLGARPGGR